MKGTLCALVTSLSIAAAACGNNDNIENGSRYNGRPPYTTTSNYGLNSSSSKSDYNKVDYRTNSSDQDDSGDGLLIYWMMMISAGSM